MHIEDVKVPNKWVTLASFIEVEDEATYVLVNSSPDIMYMVEGDVEPSETVIGVVVVPNDYITYKKGEQADLYMRNGYPPIVAGGQEQYKLSNLTINKVG